MYINVFIDLLYQKITSMITYFVIVTKYNLARIDFRAARKFRTGSYII